jgi:hypothetical protein
MKSERMRSVGCVGGFHIGLFSRGGVVVVYGVGLL